MTWETLSFICTIIMSVGGAGAIVVGLYRWAHKPTDKRDETLKKHSQLLDNDNKRLKELEEWKKQSDEWQKVMMKSMLALLSHSIDGNNTDGLKQAKNELQEYLIRR